MNGYLLQVRKPIVVNTDPQRRCYNGCNFSEEAVWSEWEWLCPFSNEADAHASAKTYKEINPTREYRVIPLKEPL